MSLHRRMTIVPTTISWPNIHDGRRGTLGLQFERSNEGIVTIDENMPQLSVRLETHGKLHAAISSGQPDCTTSRGGFALPVWTRREASSNHLIFFGKLALHNRLAPASHAKGAASLISAN